jgi:hypothetical protein
MEPIYDEDIEIDIDVIMLSAIPPKARTDEKSLEVNYYPITCIPSQHSVYGTISYNFQGLVNQPNLIYKSSGDTAPSGRTYTARELFVLTKRDGFKEFPFLGTCTGGISGDANGALVVSNYSNTNAIEPFYTVFLFGPAEETRMKEAVQSQILPLIESSTNKKGAYPEKEPLSLCINDFLVNSSTISRMFDIHENQIDHNGKKCLVGISPIQIPFTGLGHDESKHPIVNFIQNIITPTAQPESTKTKNVPIQEGFADSSTSTDLSKADVGGVDIGNFFQNTFSSSSTSSSGDVPMGSIRVPLNDDPNYTYQECTMVPVDDIDMKDTEYVYQIAGNSSIVSNKTVTIQGNLLTYLIIYFIMFLLTYFGVPFTYAFLMCTLLKRGYSYTGFSSMIDYLKRPQNFLVFGKMHGLSVLFNGIYFFALFSSLLFGSLTVGVWMIIMWITGYIGIINNPIPDTCMYI